MQILRSADIRECLAPIREGAGSGRKGKKVAAEGGGGGKRKREKEGRRRSASAVLPEAFLPPFHRSHRLPSGE